MESIHDNEQPTTPYDLPEWINDWGWYSAKTVEYQKAAIKPNERQIRMKVMVYFSKKYGEGESFFRKRLEAAMRYAEKYAARFDESNIAIASKTTDAIGLPLVVALWQSYAGRADGDLDRDFPPDAMLQAARSVAERLRSK